MKPKHYFMTAVLIIALLVSIIPACSPSVVLAADSYVAVVPKVLHSGGAESLSLTLLREGELVSGNVEVTLLSKGKEILKVDKVVEGKGTIGLNVPDIEAGDYEIKVRGAGFEDKVLVRVERSVLVFLETDKPIYKPGQTVHISVITLNAELKSDSEPVTIEALDAKGIKIFRSEVTTDEFGMFTLDLPLSGEPNLGVWKLTAVTGKGKAQLDVRVEEYTLPKYEVSIELPKDWFLVNEPIKGKVSADYSFGKPVSGEVEIKASRYVGKWEDYTAFSGAIDGEANFELPAVNYVAGVPEAGGMGNVILDVTVKEKATGYEEKSSKMLTVAQTPLNIQIIPEGAVFMPGLPFSFLITSQSPDNAPVDAQVHLDITYLNSDFEEEGKVQEDVTTSNGKTIVEVTPPEEAVALTINAFELTPISSREPARASKVVEASYSPSGNFIHIEQVSDGIPAVGDEIEFKIYSTREAANFYYEVVSRGKVIFSDFTRNREILLDTTPLMAPSSRLLVYQILPNSEVAADYVPFAVNADYPLNLSVSFGQDEARPGDDVDINITADGVTRVGIAAVDKSVFILAEDRMNLQQVFDELERLYMQPQAEIHEATIYPSILNPGAKEVFKDAGVVVLTNNIVPEGKEYKTQDQFGPWDGWGIFEGGIAMDKGMLPPMASAPTATPAPDSGEGLADVQRVRQYFPETWLWEQVTTAPNGEAVLKVKVPDNITTWMLRAVAVSKNSGLGVAEDELRAFQPFFATIDLPYSAIRGEEFPVKVAVYNYLDSPQKIRVQIEKQDWFDLLDEPVKTADINASDIGGAEFMIRPTKLGTNDIKVTVQSPQAADALIKKLIVEPEGIAREQVDNLVISQGSKSVSTSIPALAIADSGRAFITLTSSYLTQTMEGLEQLIQMPFGCGEQNMMLFAPDIFITRYLSESGQLKPEIMAKAEKLMITGYQRELVYRRSDGSFSAFGQSDDEGSLWLTAFVLKSFAQAKSLMFIDDSVLDKAKAWILSHQNADGSFDAVGFVHHQEMIGGIKGKTALTAYAAIALIEAGEQAGAARAVDYLNGKLGEIDNAYTMAITSYALELANSPKKDEAHTKLMGMAKEDENGLYWCDLVEPLPLEKPEIMPEPMPRPMPDTSSAAIETTGYATLALSKHGDILNAGKAAKWLTSKRNAYGGFGSTQDTVVALQALTEYATGTRADVDLSVKIKSSEGEKELKIDQSNFDILQVVEVPINDNIEISAQGKGEAIAQVVRRFNESQPEAINEIIKIDVNYDASQVEVNDLVNVSVNVAFNPPVPMEAGMTVVDISVPTGFSPVTDTIAQVLKTENRIKRYEIAGRKVIFYIEDLFQGDKVSFSFQVQAMYPVSAKGVSSQAYSYYMPEIRGETLGKDMTIK